MNSFQNLSGQKSPTFHEGQTSRQEVGNDVILHCFADREVHLCRWKTPYLNTYIVGEGIYVERGRIQWLGRDPNYDCTIRVANLDLRDAGTWVCEIGSSTKESFQVQTKEFVIDIESKCKQTADKKYTNSNLIVSSCSSFETLSIYCSHAKCQYRCYTCVPC